MASCGGAYAVGSKRSTGEAIITEEMPDAKKKKCTMHFGILYNMLKPSKEIHDEKLILSRKNQNLANNFQEHETVGISSPSAKRSNEHAIISEKMADAKKKKCTTNFGVLYNMLKPSNEIHDEKLISSRETSNLANNFQVHDNVCISSPSAFQNSATSCLEDYNLQRYTQDSQSFSAEIKQEILFWKDVENTLKDRVKTPTGFSTSIVSPSKPQHGTQNCSQKTPTGRNIHLAQSSNDASISRNESIQLRYQTNEVICIDFSQDETLISPHDEIICPKNLTNKDVKDIDLSVEKLFWKHIDDAFDNQENIFWKDTESAFQDRIRTGLVVNKTHIDPILFINECSKMIEVKIKDNFKKSVGLKVNAILCCEFKFVKNEKKIFELRYLYVNASDIYKNDDFDGWYSENFRDSILAKFEDHQERDSGWTLSAIINLKIIINRLKLLGGRSYIPLPNKIRSKQACVNVQNKDDACFAWAVVSALFPNKQGYRTRNYPNYKDVLNLTHIEFPMKIHQIPCFENQNNISINVFILKLTTEKDRQFNIVPTYVCRKRYKSHINMLLFKNNYSQESDSEDEDSSANNYHYCWIKSMSRLLSSQISLKYCFQYICNSCLLSFIDRSKFEEHEKVCCLKFVSIVCLPSKDSSLINHFALMKKVMRKKKAPFAIYIDFKCRLNEDHRQIPYSIGLYIKCRYDSSLSSYKSYRGEDCMQWFANVLKDFIENVETVFVCDLPKNKLSKKDRELYKENNKCFICEKPITKGSKKVRNNCRFTGVFRGPAHEICNMNFRDHRTISVFVHNRREKDSLLLMEHLETKYFNRTDIFTETRTKRKFISFVKYSDCVIKFRFINSFELINEDLDTLASNMNHFPIFRSEMSKKQCEILTKKLVYPSDRYCGDSDTFSKDSLPSISDFEDISSQDYEHANNVWKEFKLKDFGEYSDLHLKRSILLLTDVFEDFRDKCLKILELDPSYFHNLPDFSWDIMLRKTNVTLELLTDMDMFLFIENGIRGGLSQCVRNYSKANNVFLQNFNDQEQLKYLMNFKSSYLREWAMCQYLPYGDFKWVEDFDKFDVESVSDEASIGYILEVNLDYPDDIHHEHKDLPFCPEYQNEKLNASLHHKVKYVIHYRYLKLALQNGLQLTKIHRVLQFKQSAWLKPNIEWNMKLNKDDSSNDFERNLFERLNFGVFEYITKKYRDQCKGKIVTTYDKRYCVRETVHKREFQCLEILSDEQIFMESKFKKLKIDRPVYLAMCVQDLIKTKIYDFHYEYMKKTFVERCNVCHIDNDSILYEIQEKNVYDIIKKDCKTHFDTSDYPTNNVWNIPQENGGKMGMFKDKNCGRVLSEFVGLRPKLYEFKFDDEAIVPNTQNNEQQINFKRITFEDCFVFSKKCQK